MLSSFPPPSFLLPSLLLVVLLPQTAWPQQGTPALARLDIRKFEDIEIGMLADSVSTAMVRSGYMVTTVDGARHVFLGDKHVGTFFVDENVRVSGAEMEIYNASGKSDAIEFAEALYWLIHDEGSSISNDKDRVSTVTVAELGTDDFIGQARSPGISVKRIFVKTKSGALYYIDVDRFPPNFNWNVEIKKSAPFPKK